MELLWLLFGLMIGKGSDWKEWGKRWHGDDRPPEPGPPGPKPPGPPQPGPPPGPPKPAPPGGKLTPLPAGSVPYSPPPASVVARALALLPTLPFGAVSKEADPEGKWEFAAFRKENHANGKIGISAYRSTSPAGAAKPPPAPPPKKEEPQPPPEPRPPHEARKEEGGDGDELPPFTDPLPPGVDPQDPNWGKPPWERDDQWPKYGTAGGGITPGTGMGDRLVRAFEDIFSGPSDDETDDIAGDDWTEDD